MRLKLSNNSYGEKDNEIKGDFNVITQSQEFYNERLDQSYIFTQYYIELNTLEELVEFIKLNGAIYITEDKTLGYGDFYIE